MGYTKDQGLTDLAKDVEDFAGDRLNDWEATFISDVINQDYDYTTAQADKIHELAERYL